MPDVTRDFTVATFVVHDGRVLLLYHRALGMWLPPGGHIEPNELPDDAAVREVREEAGIEVELVGERALPAAGQPGVPEKGKPVQLVIPRGVQLEEIRPGHQHIDFVYFARPVGSPVVRGNAESTQIGWFGREDLQAVDLTDEMRQWVELALRALDGPAADR